MPPIDLLHTTGDGQVDDILRGLVGLFETVFPARIRGHYLLGSFADGTAQPGSDIDLCVLFRDGFQDAAEEARAADLVDHCARISPVELDVDPIDEPIPYRLRAVNVKLASRLIYGEDIRGAIPLPPIDAYARDALDLAVRLLARVRQNPPVLTFPLDYPDPAGEFYGYDRRPMRDTVGSTLSSTKDLVVTIGLIATAIIALQAGRYVGNKRDGLRLYQTEIGDAWTALVTAISARCRDRWSYRVPERAEDRRRLRALCQEALAFENHFLALYRDHLLAELHHEGADRRQRAVQRLGEVIYPD
jgi:predicted nucleotidyltransferase